MVTPAAAAEGMDVAEEDAEGIEAASTIPAPGAAAAAIEGVAVATAAAATIAAASVAVPEEEEEVVAVADGETLPSYGGSLLTRIPSHPLQPTSVPNPLLTVH